MDDKDTNECLKCSIKFTFKLRRVNSKTFYKNGFFFVITRNNNKHHCRGNYLKEPFVLFCNVIGNSVLIVQYASLAQIPQPLNYNKCR